MDPANSLCRIVCLRLSRCIILRSMQLALLLLLRLPSFHLFWAASGPSCFRIRTNPKTCRLLWIKVHVDILEIILCHDLLLAPSRMPLSLRVEEVLH
jgi:hypothetical protein